jgi:type I restriction enzyme M protein
MIDASGIYTPQRAQNIMTEADIQRVFNLYQDYEDVVERVKVVSIADIREKGYTLAINNYIEKKEQETVPPEEVQRQYFEAYEEMLAAEEYMRKLLVEGGYVSE